MIIEEINILRQHGWQYIPDPQKAEVPAPFRGRPEIQVGMSQDTQQALSDLCPVEAIGMNPLSIDLGKCYFCGECAMAYPQAIRFTNDHRLWAQRARSANVTPKSTGLRPSSCTARRRFAKDAGLSNKKPPDMAPLSAMK